MAQQHDMGGRAASAAKVKREIRGEKTPSNKKQKKHDRHARASAGTLYEPEAKKISYIPLGAGAPDFAFVALDTGTDRPGLEKSTYKIRREECDAFAEELFAKSFINRPVLADVKVLEDFGKIRDAYTDTKWAPHLERLRVPRERPGELPRYDRRVAPRRRRGRWALI